MLKDAFYAFFISDLIEHEMRNKCKKFQAEKKTWQVSVGHGWLTPLLQETELLDK